METKRKEKAGANQMSSRPMGWNLIYFDCDRSTEPRVSWGDGLPKPLSGSCGYVRDVSLVAGEREPERTQNWPENPGRK